MTYDTAPLIIRLWERHGFHAVFVSMPICHHNRLSETVITHKRIFALVQGQQTQWGDHERFDHEEADQ